MFDRQEGLFEAGAVQDDLFGGDGGDDGGEGLAVPSDREEPVSPLDVPKVFEEATSFQVRGEFEKLVRKDLLGPWHGEYEELPKRSRGPRDRYLVGMLGPKRLVRSVLESADEQPDVDVAVGGDGSSGELNDVLTPQILGRIWASSMGLSCTVPADVDLLAVTASWGRYGISEVEDEDGRKVNVWVRTPVAHRLEVRLDEGRRDRIPLTMHRAEDPGVYLSVAVRDLPNARRVVELALVNGQEEPESRKDTSWLFQSELRVTALDGAAPVFLPIGDPTDDAPGTSLDGEDAHLRLLYRDELRHATGRNVAVHAEVRAGERRAHELCTTWIPAFDVPTTIAPDGDLRLAGVELSMDRLAHVDVAELAAGLSPLADGYALWLDEQAALIAGLPEGLRDAATAAVHRARQAATRIRAGIVLLTDPGRARHGEALRAFRFANRAMALQRRHTLIAGLREEQGLGFGEAEAQVASRGTDAAKWRPFQLAFMLLNLPSLTDPTHPERSRGAESASTAVVDLLFFPTGGGKTEAYLGLTAYTFAIRRIQGELGAGTDKRSGLDGVAVLMRYTLRLLTAQQFQRAASLVCAAEILRREDPGQWGREPFRIGLWVGSAVSPNWFPDAQRQIADARTAGRGDRVNVLQTLTCPWCGTRLRGHQDLYPDDDRRRVLLYCPNGEGQRACPFSQRMSPGEGLPILTVDEEIYRLTPSLVIATVDKLAQLPWRGYAGHLFGRVGQYCPRHGYRHDDLDDKTKCGNRHNSKGNLPAVTSTGVVRLRPPDLVIQDELHLISGALGTVVGLFEAAVDELSTWTFEGRETGPKIVASTATTKRAQEQILGVFGQGHAVFPPQVIDVKDTFFSRRVPVTEANPGRRYLGLCAHGTRLKAAEIRLAEILLLAGQTMFDRYGRAADPYMTTVGYFNATRELAGMRRYLDDDVAIRVRRHGSLKGLSNRLVARNAVLNIQELTARISSGDISEVLKRLELGFDPDLDTSARRREIMAHKRETQPALRGRKDSHGRRGESALHPLAAREHERSTAGRQPIDFALATSMLQVGVDVSRFGLMVVTGQPKNTAEYIQASSRVGRDPLRPGLVITLYSWTRPRDLAHYEDFEHYHATFYRQVEALSVTPYTRRALDRGTTAAFVAAVRNTAGDHSRNEDAHDVDLDGDDVRRVVARWLDRAGYIAGERAREYLAERIAVVCDAWRRERSGQFALGYQEQRKRGRERTGLLKLPGSASWGELTVGNSMRETEREINMLLPGGGEIFTPLYDAPGWSFRLDATASEDSRADEGDEMGMTGGREGNER
ncbi:Helicase conserved C-terminal domain-containing protein [Sinosporangium album]|uniref:Helicase conserved C-terminal domain-containing protein n=1 Tax=Sinosporangium album TaxID=504805 RepID=A0A1G7RCC6_9ACTN|nr:DISARM system helicase DrmA [Sinosporangium album]SDG08441.1 Helicase conserved C-terminal domain-containing protein [Sinosporangium album]